MIQTLVAIGVAIWFFRAARAVGKSGVAWAMIGVIAIIAPSVPWILFARAAIFPSLLRLDSGAVVGLVAFGVASIGVLFGLALAHWVYSANLRAEVPGTSTPGTVTSHAPDATGSRGAAQNLAASGYSAAQISNELQKWRGLGTTEADELARSVTSRPAA